MREELFVKIDSHAHIAADELYDEVDVVIERAIQKCVKPIINIATCHKTLVRALALTKKYPEIIYTTAATTPHDVYKEGESFFPLVEKAAMEGSLVAIGETGLDYYYEHSDRKSQIHFLERYLDLAQRANLNVVIHSRGDEAFTDLFTITKKQKKMPKCLLHCFTGNAHHVKEAIERGWMISISGIITFKKSEELRNVVKEIPLEHLLIETDAPYLAPQSKRGQRNEPSYLNEIAKMIAEIKEIPLEQLCSQTVKNSWSFFQLSHRITAR